MNLWSRVELLQAAILIFCVILGRAALRLSWLVSILAAVLVLPAPILQLSPGVAGFVYAGDVIGLCGVIFFLINPRFRRSVSRSAGRPLLAAVFGVLLVWPATATFISVLCDPDRHVKFIALGIGRGLTYTGLFFLAMYYAPRIRDLGAVLTVQLCGLVLVCGAGVYSFWTGANTDLWNFVAKLNPGEFSYGLGGGLMGLYRGAVGAWVAAALGVAPVVLLNRRIGWLLTPVAAVILVAAALLTGSRQGAVMGAAAFLLGIGLSVAGLRATKMFALLTKTAVILAALAGIGYYWATEWSSPITQAWILRRLEVVLHSEDIATTALSRDDNIEGVMHKLADDPIVAVSGVGFGKIVDAAPGGPRDLVYVDSELFWTLQQGGLVLAGLYLFVLWKIGRTCLRLRGVPGYKVPASAAFAALCAGCLLLYGHFFLLHVHSSEAPIALWHWSLYGGLIGISGTARLRRPVCALVRYPLTPGVAVEPVMAARWPLPLSRGRV